MYNKKAFFAIRLLFDELSDISNKLKNCCSNAFPKESGYFLRRNFLRLFLFSLLSTFLSITFRIQAQKPLRSK